MLIKAGVDISRLKREIRRSLVKTDAFVDHHNEELTITSTYEGNHGVGSLHYADEAYDIRRPLGVQLSNMSLLRDSLGSDYDVVLNINHIHIEYDPKKG